MPPCDPASVQRITILGAGTIGSGWAAHFLACGKKVTVTDPAPGSADRVSAFIESTWPALVQLGTAKVDAPPTHRFVEDPAEAVQDAQFVQESAPENLEIKRVLYERVEATMPENTVVSTSTSGILISDLQEGRLHPERFVVGHPFNPPYLVPLVEVVGGRHTSPELVDWTVNFYRLHQKHPIKLNKEVPGHLANRLQMALWREAVHAAIEGIASMEDIDAAVTEALGIRWAVVGPHLTVHLAGGPGGIHHQLEHLGPGIQAWFDDLGTPNLTPEVKDHLVNGMNEALAGREFESLVEQRDRELVDLLRERRQSRGK